MPANRLAPFALFVAFSAHAIACECIPPPPPCEAVGRSEFVFLGTVTAMTEPAGSFKTASMHVDKAFKGELNTTVNLFDDGMCDGPNLQVGKQYLIYTSAIPGGGGMPARGCTRSRGVEYAAEDLAFLKQYGTGYAATHISGTVRFRPDEPDDSKLGDAGRTPLNNVQITLSGDGVQFSAQTNPSGDYLFENMAPGRYSVAADLTGYRLYRAPNEITLAANGCAQADLLMKAIEEWRESSAILLANLRAVYLLRWHLPTQKSSGGCNPDCWTFRTRPGITQSTVCRQVNTTWE